MIGHSTVGPSNNLKRIGNLLDQRTMFYCLLLGIASLMLAVAGCYPAAGDLEGRSADALQQKNYSQAESYYYQAFAEEERVNGTPDFSIDTLHSLAAADIREGRYADAERLYRHSIELMSSGGPAKFSLSTMSTREGQLAEELGQLYIAEGRMLDAETMLGLAIQISVSAKHGAVNPGGIEVYYALASVSETLSQRSQPARRLNEEIIQKTRTTPIQLGQDIGFVYLSEGRLADAEMVLPLLVQILASHPTDWWDAAVITPILNNAGVLYYEERSYDRAEPLLRRALDVQRARHLVPNPYLMNNLAALSFKQGRKAEAETLLTDAVNLEKAAGRENTIMEGNLGVVLASEGKAAAARPYFERARVRALNVSRGDADELTVQSLSAFLPGYVSMLAEIVRDPRLDSSLSPEQAEKKSFEAAEQRRGGIAQAALISEGVRAAASDPASADLVRQTQDLVHERSAVTAQIDTEELGTLVGGSRKHLKNLEKVSASINDQLAAARTRLYATFPKYRELTAPDPISIDQAQALLRPGEALISYSALGDRVLAWLVRPGEPLVYRDTPIKRAEFDAQIARVRASLKPDRPYDVVDAYALYKVLLEPFKAELASLRNLILVPDEALLPVPLAALVTNDEGPAYATLADDYRKGLAPSPEDLKQQYTRVAWLAQERFALSELPSATSLRVLRGLQTAAALPSASSEPFIGVGDPLLDGSANVRGGAMIASRGAEAVADIRRLPQLPGTRDELMADAKTLGADPSTSLFLQDHATKPQVMELNRDRLANARVVAFATHALIGGELVGLNEPALVLTPPSQPSETDDGLLLLEDVLGLKLRQTQWVVLSACNTAAPSGSGEGFSGLTRAFFYAGTPSLLVSQWSVDDAATDQLMTHLFTVYGKGADASRATALHDAMLKLMNVPRTDQAHAYFAHPFAWAPFIVVGEGGPSIQ
jgi:CHAT domain-containing protein/Flp pilus assembly protein TadD